MDPYGIAVLAGVAWLAASAVIALLVGGPAFRRAVGRHARALLYLRCWPFVMDPFRALREYERSWERCAQDGDGVPGTMAQMTPDEERAFWQEQAKRLREEQKAAARNREEAGSSAR